MTSADDVRAAVDAGADAVGIILAPSPRRVAPADVARVVESLPPYVCGVAVVADPSPEEIAAAREASLSFQFCGDESGTTCVAASGGRPYVKVRHLVPARCYRPSPSLATHVREAQSTETAFLTDVRFTGDEPPATGQLLADVRAHPLATWQFDTKVDGKLGGTGYAFDWRAIATFAAAHHVIVAGGLTPHNVGACVRAARPFAVDVRGGVETGGRPDPAKMRAFVRAVREADAEA